MAAAAELQVGAGYSFGIAESTQGTAVNMTAVAGVITVNMMNRDVQDNFKSETMPSQNGAVIESMVASQRRKDYSADFIPKGATRALAQAVFWTLSQLTPFSIITIANSALTFMNGGYNYMGGCQPKETREGWAVANIKLAQFESALTANTFIPLVGVT